MNAYSHSANHIRFGFRSIRYRSGCSLAVRLSALLAGISVLLQSGCLALNIPSQRNNDPQDSGGILGSWEDPARPGRVLKEILVGPPPEAVTNNCDDLHSLGVDFGNEPFDASETVQPEVPWPKYHPVPTRPVFGG